MLALIGLLLIAFGGDLTGTQLFGLILIILAGLSD